MRLDVRLCCDLADVPPAAADAFKASAERLFNAALERVKELLTAMPRNHRGPIVGEAERGEAERLVGTHRASVNDKDPLARRSLWRGGSRSQLSWRAVWRWPSSLRLTGGLSGGGDFN